MSTEKPYKLLIVDDAPEDIRLLVNALRADFSLNTAKSAEEALSYLNASPKPDIILMDINMPGLNGYEACRSIKQNPKWADIDILFLSSKDSTQEVLDGFDAGATDYLVKPYTPAILLSKLKQCLINREAKKQLAEAAKVANAIAFNAMLDTGNLGTVMNFMRASFNIKTLEELADETLKALTQFDLVACLHFYTDSQTCTRATDGEPSEIEKNIMERLTHSEEPIINKGPRLILIKPHAVIFIKNFPSNPVNANRIKDHLMILLEAIVAKTQSLQYAQQVRHLLNNNINLVIHQVEKALTEMQTQQEAHKKRFIDIMEAMVQKVEESFFPLGLTDTQEDSLLHIMSSSVNTALDHLHEGLELDKTVKTIILSLSKVAHS